MASDPPICWRWRNGKCKYGDGCRYSHDIIPGTISPPTTATRASVAKKFKKQFWKNSKMMKGTGAMVRKIELSAIKKFTKVVEIRDFTFIASYNWCDSDEPIIYVPGCPAKWDPPKLPCKVPKDHGKIFIDQNSHRCLSASFDPFFKALLAMRSNFDMKSIELATDRNSLRKLLRFASGNVPASWRIDVDIVEDTIFFTRWEEDQIQIITGTRNSGYGHEFEKAFTSCDSSVGQNSGHHRIVRYNLGGIECLVRFEVDGYVDDALTVDNPQSTGTFDNQTSNVDDLGQSLSGLVINDSTSTLKPPTAASVKVVPKGRLVSDDTIFELKSRSGNLKLQEIIPQLWISQTPHLFVGRHVGGRVELKPERMHMTEHFTAWEIKNQEQLKTLVGLILEIKEAVKAAGGKCVLVCKMEETPRVLTLYQRNGKGIFLPEGARDGCWATEKERQAKQAQR